MYDIKDGGNHLRLESGALREDQTGRPRYDLIPPGPLKRVADQYARGAKKYNEHNWAKGTPTSRFLAAAMRHLEQYRMGETDEDHLAAVIFNVMGIMHFEGTDMDDAYDWTYCGSDRDQLPPGRAEEGSVPRPPF